MYRGKWKKQECVYAYSFLSEGEGRTAEGRGGTGKGERRRQGEKQGKSLGRDSSSRL